MNAQAQKIRAEIERRITMLRIGCKHSEANELLPILSFIDSLQDEPKGKICPHCGAVMKLQEDRVYTSNPPKYGYTCPKCGALEFDTEYLYRRLKEIETKAAKQS